MPKKLNSSQSIAEQLGGTEDICLITKDILEEIIHENASFQRKQLEISNDVANSMIAETMVDISNNILTETIKQNNASFTSSTSFTKKIVRHENDELLNEPTPFARKEFRTKVIRTYVYFDFYDMNCFIIDNRCSLYEMSPPPFARKEFRTKVIRTYVYFDF